MDNRRCPNGNSCGTSNENFVFLAFQSSRMLNVVAIPRRLNFFVWIRFDIQSHCVDSTTMTHTSKTIDSDCLRIRWQTKKLRHIQLNDERTSDCNQSLHPHISGYLKAKTSIFSLSYYKLHSLCRLCAEVHCPVIIFSLLNNDESLKKLGFRSFIRPFFIVDQCIQCMCNALGVSNFSDVIVMPSHLSQIVRGMEPVRYILIMPRERERDGRKNSYISLSYFNLFCLLWMHTISVCCSTCLPNLSVCLTGFNVCALSVV